MVDPECRSRLAAGKEPCTSREKLGGQNNKNQNEWDLLGDLGASHIS